MKLPEGNLQIGFLCIIVSKILLSDQATGFYWSLCYICNNYKWLLCMSLLHGKIIIVKSTGQGTGRFVQILTIVSSHWAGRFVSVFLIHCRNAGSYQTKTLWQAGDFGQN